MSLPWGGPLYFPQARRHFTQVAHFCNNRGYTAYKGIQKARLGVSRQGAEPASRLSFGYGIVRPCLTAPPLLKRTATFEWNAPTRFLDENGKPVAASELKTGEREFRTETAKRDSRLEEHRSDAGRSRYQSRLRHSRCVRKGATGEAKTGQLHEFLG